jgi:hypothetical protein
MWSDLFWSVLLGSCITLWARRANARQSGHWTYADLTVLSLILALAVFSSYQLFVQ